MSQIVVLTGVPGSGKTTVTRKAIENLEALGTSFEMVTYSDVMLDEAVQRGWVQIRDEIRKLDPRKQRELQRIAAQTIAERATTSLIVDTHATMRTPKGYLPGLPVWVLDELKPDIILVVEATPKEIMRRRHKDKSRIRDIQGEQGIQEHQEANRAICMAYAAHTGATVKILQNSEGKLSETAQELMLTLQGD